MSQPKNSGDRRDGKWTEKLNPSDEKLEDLNVPEVATDTITGGVPPNTSGTEAEDSHGVG